ncbi:MAG: DUF1223 domain-containing protein [Pseudomonadota bacterium]
MRILICAFAFLISYWPVSSAAQSQPSPVLVELFTAENCPACPPADQYLGQLAESQHVMALACHVDYFGRGSIGLGKKACTRRQEVYRKQLDKQKYYTPQMMINGTREEIGYKSDKIAAEISKARGDRSRPIVIQHKASGVYDYRLPYMGSFRVPAQLWIATYAKPYQSIERGMRKNYYNVVQNFIPLGFWQGGASQKIVYPITDSRTAGLVIAAQDSLTGQILAVGEYRL